MGRPKTIGDNPAMTSVLLSETNVNDLARLSFLSGKSKSKLIREAIDVYVKIYNKQQADA